MLAKRPWDIVVLALALPGQDGFYLLQEIQRLYVSTRALVLTMHGDVYYAVRSREMGASGYVCKDAGRTELLKALKSVLDGKEYFQNFPPLERVALTVPGKVALSAREREVMLAFAAGKRTGEIAAELNLSVKVAPLMWRSLPKPSSA